MSYSFQIQQQPSINNNPLHSISSSRQHSSTSFSKQYKTKTIVPQATISKLISYFQQLYQAFIELAQIRYLSQKQKSHFAQIAQKVKSIKRQQAKPKMTIHEIDDSNMDQQEYQQQRRLQRNNNSNFQVSQHETSRRGRLDQNIPMDSEGQVQFPTQHLTKFIQQQIVLSIQQFDQKKQFNGIVQQFSLHQQKTQQQSQQIIEQMVQFPMIRKLKVNEFSLSILTQFDIDNSEHYGNIQQLTMKDFKNILKKQLKSFNLSLFKQIVLYDQCQSKIKKDILNSFKWKDLKKIILQQFNWQKKTRNYDYVSQFLVKLNYKIEFLELWTNYLDQKMMTKFLQVSFQNVQKVIINTQFIVSPVQKILQNLPLSLRSKIFLKKTLPKEQLRSILFYNSLTEKFQLKQIQQNQIMIDYFLKQEIINQKKIFLQEFKQQNSCLKYKKNKRKLNKYIIQLKQGQKIQKVLNSLFRFMWNELSDISFDQFKGFDKYFWEQFCKSSNLFQNVKEITIDLTHVNIIYRTDLSNFKSLKEISIHCNNKQLQGTQFQKSQLVLLEQFDKMNPKIKHQYMGYYQF